MEKKIKKNTKEKVDKKILITRIILLILIIIWAVVVYSLSNQSGTESSGVSRKVAEVIFKEEKMVEKAEPAIRKTAHFSEYSVGGVLFYMLFSTYNFSKNKRMFISLGLGIWYAALDEIHQLFIPGRSGSIRDVCIDSAGFLFGIILIRIFFKIIEVLKNKFIKRKTNENINNN